MVVQDLLGNVVGGLGVGSAPLGPGPGLWTPGDTLIAQENANEGDVGTRKPTFAHRPSTGDGGSFTDLLRPPQTPTGLHRHPQTPLDTHRPDPYPTHHCVYLYLYTLRLLVLGATTSSTSVVHLPSQSRSDVLMYWY